MTLDKKSYLKAVVIMIEGAAIFHVKTLDAPHTCYRASLRGKLKRKKREFFLKPLDIVHIKILQTNKNTAKIFEKVYEPTQVIFNCKEQDHVCTFRTDSEDL